ncbi:MAG: glycosyltransferase family 9 protein [Desulfobacterales bacterium]|jgi:ADP-heptose:LPS heptosyltransferase
MSFKKICIIHLNQIGDLIFSLPLLKALRENHPNASIHSLVKPYLQKLLIDSPFVDRVIPRKSGLTAQFKLLKNIRKNNYDLLISLARAEECLILTALSRAKIKAGFSYFPWDWCLNIKENIEGHNSWYNNAKLLKRLNVTVTKTDYVGLLNVNKNNSDLSLPEKFVIISPGTSKRRLTKTWQKEKFAQLILLLKEKYGLYSVLVGGADNKTENNKIIEILEQKKPGKDVDILDLTGKVDLACLCSVIKEATLFVGIDSGVMHMASSLNIPVVGLFGPTDPFYVGPQNKKSIVVREESMECVPCYLKNCKHRDCMKNLSVSKVFDGCKELLIQQ